MKGKSLCTYGNPHSIAVYVKSKLWIFSIAFLVSIVVMVVGHELIHLLFGRIMGIPAGFLSATSVGVPATYPIQNNSWWAWFLMNEVAPVLTLLVGALLLIIFLRNRFFILTRIGYFFSWLVIEQIPYLGVQVSTAGNESTATGSGPDFAYFLFAIGQGTNKSLITLLTLSTFVLFPLCFYLASFIWEAYTNLHPLSRLRKIVAFIILLIPAGYFLFALYNFIFFGKGPVSDIHIVLFWVNVPAIAFAFLIDWKNKTIQSLMQLYFFPALLVCVLFLVASVLPIAGIGYFLNDFGTFLFMIPAFIICIIFFRQITTRRESL